MRIPSGPPAPGVAPPDRDPAGGRKFRSHLIPRTSAGWFAVVLFLGFLALAEPPFVYWYGNRIDPWVLGLPFLYAYLLCIYVALIGVLIWVWRRGL